MSGLEYQISSYSNAEGNCIGVTPVDQDGLRHVGDSKLDWEGGFTITPQALGHFILGIKQEELV